MNELFGTISDLPIFYLVPLFVFGPVFFLVLYNLGLKDIINPSPQVREQRRRLKEEAARLGEETSKKSSRLIQRKKSARRTPRQWAGQIMTYSLFAFVAAYFSNTPQYTANSPEMAKIMLSFSHAGKHKKKCHKRTREELAKLAENMRAPTTCPRERWPVAVELVLNGKSIYKGVATPAGLSKDGHSNFYQPFSVTAGKHRIKVGVLDSGEITKRGVFDYVLEREVVLSPTEILVIGFDNAGKQIFLE